MSTLSPSSLRAAACVLLSGVLLAACSSTPIAETPASSGASASAGGKSPGASGQSSVAPVTAAKTPGDALGPTGADRLVYFDYDSYVIRPEFQSVIDAHARFLGAHQDRKLLIGGHTDERGGREYNVALGQQRADAVRQALQLLGARPAQLEAVSYGEEKPMEAAHEEAAWSRNRRAELTYR